MSGFSIETRKIGEDQPCFVIAEVAQAHDGSLGMAHAFIDAAAQSGADAIKFQTHIAAAESTLDEPFRVAFSKQDATRYAYWKRMEFTPEQWDGLSRHAQEKGLIFLSSAFSLEAVALLEKLGMAAWKLGSGEFHSLELLEAMAATGVPLLLSTGMCTMVEVEAMAAFSQAKKRDFALFQCTSLYPTPLEKVGLNLLQEYRRFGCPVGLSDHSGTLFPGLAAMAQGASLLELHVTFDKRMFGPDTAASVTFAELTQLVQARDAFHAMQTHPVDKDAQAETLETMRGLFTKSVAPAMALPAGTILTEAMLRPKKPGTGIPYAERVGLIGKTLRHDVTPEHLLRWDDVI